MASTSQPIALPSSSHNADYSMAEGSYTGSSGMFNPASYTRHFLGSPISWLAGSFGVSGSFGGGRFPMGSPTAQLLSSIDPNEFRAGKTPSSTDGSILNALNIFDRDRELCQNYTCCGLQLNDLHALLEHFEEVHIVVLDPTAPQPQAHIQVPFYPQSHDSDPSSSHHNKATPCPSLNNHYHLQQQRNQQPYPAPFDADDMELELDLDNSTQPPPPPTPSQSSSHSSPSSGAPSPPDTPISTPLSAYPSPHAFIPHHLPQHSHVSAYISQPSSPLSNYDNSVSSTRHSSPTAGTRPNLNLNLSSFPRSHLNSPALVPNPEEVFNPYARFSSDYSSCMPGAQFNGANVDEASALHGVSPTHWQQLQQEHHQNQGQCVPPALLFSSSASVTPSSTPGGSRVPSPTTGYAHPLSNAQSPISSVPPASPAAAPLSSHNKSHTAPNSGASTPVRSSSSSSAVAGATLSRPGSSLLLSKPFRCPKPNCNKSYKQANGLKYHMTHGSCNFAPPKDLEHVKDLLERKRRDKEREAGLTRSASCGSALGSAGGAGATAPGGHDVASEVRNEQGVLTYGELGNISETELREVEKEAEKRLRPFACGVGDCQRRYKNMNGLRYHYQHSGDHGAVGLALLASGQHECLQHGAAKRQLLQQQLGGGGGTDAEREGRKRFLGGKGSVSVPVSRAGSASRTGTPQPLVQVHYSTGTSTSGVPPTTAMTTPIQATPVQPFSSSSSNVNGTTVSTPASPTFTTQQQQQQQQQMAYQYAHVHAQMQRQYAAMQQQQHAVQQQQAAAAAQQVQAQQQQQQQAQIVHQVHMQSPRQVHSPHQQQVHSSQHQQVHSQPQSPSRYSPRHSHSSSQGSDSSSSVSVSYRGGEGQGQYVQSPQQKHFVPEYAAAAATEQGFVDQQQQGFVDQQQQQGFVDQQQGFVDQQQNFVDQQVQQQNFVDQTQQQQQHFSDTHFAALYAQHQQQLYAAGHAMDMS